MYFSVKDFGKIKEARVNISNFAIFVGNNNSGKTQLMELIYTVIKRVSELRPDIQIPQIQDADAYRVGKQEISLLNKWVNEYLRQHIDRWISDAFNISIPIKEAALEFENADVNYEIYFLTDRTIIYLLKERIVTQDALTNMLLGITEYDRVLIVKTDKQGKRKKIFGHSFLVGFSIELVKSSVMGRILGEIMGAGSGRSSNVLFLPASRMGLMLLYKHYFGNVMQNKDELIFEKNQNSKGITKPVLDFLSFLLTYSYTERIAEKNETLINFIFNHLTDGKISEKGETTVYTPKGQTNEIPVYVASSMVNEIVPVVKALTASDRIDFLLYDEVETSMHPLKQIEMAKLLNRLNNQGIRLIVSTHSDTMATKINNLALLSSSNTAFEEKQKILREKGIQIEKEDLLNSKNIHIYQFANETDGKSSVQELQFEKVPCTGYDFSQFNDSTMNLFEEARIVMGIDDEN